eukprot:2177045-Rhodomonas_salina.2
MERRSGSGRAEEEGEEAPGLRGELGRRACEGRGAVCEPTTTTTTRRVGWYKAKAGSQAQVEREYCSAWGYDGELAMFENCTAGLYLLLLPVYDPITVPPNCTAHYPR